MSLLIVSSRKDSREFFARGFRELGNHVDEAEDANDGYLLACEKGYDCIVVDRNLHGISGVSLLAFMRDNHIGAPVIIIGEKADLDDTLAAFEAGADDFISQPVMIAELAARMKAIMSRGPALKEDGMLSVCDLSLNRLTRQVWRNGTQIQLQPRSYSLLEILMENAGTVVTRTTLLETVWEYHFDPCSGVVETHISRLREKVDKPFETRLISTIRGGGYMISDPAIPGVI